MTEHTRTGGRFARKLDEAALVDALRRYVETDEHIRDIAASLNVHHVYLLNMLRGQPGYAEAADRRRRAAPARNAWPQRDDELRAHRAAGLTRKQIAAAMGLSEDVIRYRMHELALPRAGETKEQAEQRRAEHTARLAAQKVRRQAKRRAEGKLVMVAAQPKPAAAAAPSEPVPFPPRRPGADWPPVPRTWAQIRALARAEGAIVANLGDLELWNRTRRRRGDAPVCISDRGRERDAA